MEEADDNDDNDASLDNVLELSWPHASWPEQAPLPTTQVLAYVSKHHARRYVYMGT